MIEVDEDRLARLERRLDELASMVAERDRAIAERDRIIAEQQQTIAEQQQTIAEQQQTIERLEARVRELEEQLGRNSSNSGKPPSSDSPKDRKQRPSRGRKRSGRKRGGQPGHKGHKRELLPPEKVTTFVECRPQTCSCCGEQLPELGPNVEVRRHQVVELPPIVPEVTEYQLLRLTCPACDSVTEGSLPAGAPPGAFGPRLTALVALMSGVYRLSKRGIAEFLSDVVGIRMSLGSVSKCERRVSGAVKTAVDEAAEAVQGDDVRYVDASSWYRAGARKHLWVMATQLLSVFAITARGTAEVVRQLLGGVRGTVVCDRATSFNDWSAEMRQTCWAHLRRYFTQYAERGGESAAIGKELLDLTRAMFVALHRIRDGSMTEDSFRDNIEPVKRRFRDLLEAGAECDNAKTAGSCKNILDYHWAAMWTFLDNGEVEPTNNHAERELRHAVIWRKTSFGTQSPGGDRFVERILTVVRSLRKQRRHVYEFLATSCRQRWAGQQGPSLMHDETL